MIVFTFKIFLFRNLGKTRFINKTSGVKYRKTEIQSVLRSLSATPKSPLVSLSIAIDIDGHSNAIQEDRNTGLIAYSSQYVWLDLHRLPDPRGASWSFVWATASSSHCTCPRTGRAKCRAAGRDQVDLRPACVINSPDFTDETIVDATPLTRLS